MLFEFLRKSRKNNTVENEKDGKWNLKNDIIVTDRCPLFSIEEAKKYGNSVFCINTEKGIFYQKKRGSTFDIVLLNSVGLEVAMKNSFVVSADGQYTCFIVRNNTLEKSYIIDTRGIFFELPSLDKKYFLGPGQYSFAFERKTGCYKIQDYNEVVLWEIRAKSEEDTNAYLQEITPDETLSINPEFKKFISKMKRGNHKYFCCVCDSSKQGQIVKWLTTKGLPYSVMPNIFVDDDTVNIMVEINMENCTDKDVLYLISKYKSSYSIFNIPITHYLSAMNSFGARHEFTLNLSSLKEPELKMCDTIINTMKLLLSIDSDDKLYEHVFRPILQLFYVGVRYSQNNEFSYAFVPINDTEYDTIPNPFSNNEELQKYESALLIKMEKDGIRISKWKSEVEMFSLIYQHYSDAIYQYHSSWLGAQSIDVYIPSLKIGFEYQGIQHFEPIDFFGGEEGFKGIQERDSRKKRLCKEQGVKLIYWLYDEPVNELILREKIRDISRKK